mgnify:CR=1 FL=1
MSSEHPTAPESDQGLETRYLVRRLRDVAGKHGNCRYFVLDPQHDPIARQALATYADAVATSHPALSRDLWRWLGEVTP